MEEEKCFVVIYFSKRDFSLFRFHWRFFDDELVEVLVQLANANFSFRPNNIGELDKLVRLEWII
jgi:hypothetical protein